MAERRPVLLTVSGTIPHDLDEQVAARARPRADYRVLAERLDADLIDVGSALADSPRLGRLLHRIAGPGPLLAWCAFGRRKRYRAVLTDGEQVGLPLALLTRLFGAGGCRHAMIVHILSVPKKARLVRLLRLGTRIDRYFVYSSRQQEFAEAELGVPPERIVLTTFMVDAGFFSLEHTDEPVRRRICSAGLERRDYPTLMEAVDGLDVEVVIAAASPWSKQPDSSAARSIPSNVTIERLDLFELRRLYASSQFVVMPLVEVDFQAGITTILEAMAMERAVVCTRTAGQTDTLVDGETGAYVPPADANALRAAIERLLADEPERSRLGSAARAWVTANADVDRYADRIGVAMAELTAD